MESKTAIGQKIRDLRVKHGLTQRQLAVRLGVTGKAVSKWENDFSFPSIAVFRRICTFFNVSFESFFTVESDASAFRKKEMGSLEQLYKTGMGPSSSHTIGPERICHRYQELYPQADSYKVTLYGSLAFTGIGHGTDVVIRKTLAPATVEIRCDREKTGLFHPNAMRIAAYKCGEPLDSRMAYSIGGGDVIIDGLEQGSLNNRYQFDSFKKIADYCKMKKMRLWQYASECEGEALDAFLLSVWNEMKDGIERGLTTDGVLPGGLLVKRKAKFLFEQTHIDETRETRENRIVCAYAYALGEENAAGGRIVTAPTCGSCGVLPSVLLYYQQKCGFSDQKIIRALATAGIVGLLVRRNASISGAECGCQAEIGTACSMAAAALAELFEMRIDQIEYAAEIAIEHHLGLTCDPICGLVQIPCIERNAVAAMRAINAVNLANFLTDTRKISFDLIIKAMNETGRDLRSPYRETSTGGMAKLYRE